MSESQSEEQPAGEEELTASNPNATSPDGAAGGMGVSSEREGPTGPGQHRTDGQLDTRPGEASLDHADPDIAEDENPDAPIPPKSGYNSRDPRSDEAPYRPGPEHARED